MPPPAFLIKMLVLDVVGALKETEWRWSLPMLVFRGGALVTMPVDETYTRRNHGLQLKGAGEISNFRCCWEQSPCLTTLVWRRKENRKALHITRASCKADNFQLGEDKTTLIDRSETIESRQRSVDLGDSRTLDFFR